MNALNPTLSAESFRSARFGTQKTTTPGASTMSGKNMEKEADNLKSVAKSLLSRSSIFAVAQLVTSSGFGRKVLWLVVLLVGLLGCSYEIYRFLNLYFQYPVVITLEVENNWKLDFPAVTVCNLNRIPIYYYECILTNRTVEECLNLSCEDRREIRQGGRTNPILISERKKFVSCSNEFEGTISSHQEDLLLFLNIYLNSSDEQRKKLGYNARSLITGCTYNGESCSSGNFSEFLSIGFGNCFTFNSRYNTGEKSIQTPYIGPNSGLELTFNLHRGDYSNLSPSVGLRVVIHEPYTLPNPEDHGINISPQFETSVALRQTAIYRLPYPYRDMCRNYDERKENYPPNQETCIWKCMQSKNLERCGCIDPLLPKDQDAQLCDLQNQTEVCCLDEVIKSLSEDDTPCPCPLPCKSLNYEMTVSTAEWPTFQYYKEFLGDPPPVSHPCVHAPKNKRYGTEFTRSTEDDLSNFNTSSSTQQTPVDETSECSRSSCTRDKSDHYDIDKINIAKLKVFYKTLEKSYYKQEPMFQESELFSQLGGQLGLWLGVSLVALFECIENISHLIHYCIKRPSGKEKELYIPPQSEKLSI